jgi:hypothetical protein
MTQPAQWDSFEPDARCEQQDRAIECHGFSIRQDHFWARSVTWCQ